MPMQLPPIDFVIYILLIGFSLGIIAYNIVLFWCTREKIYLHFAIALFGSILSIVFKMQLWQIEIWPQYSMMGILNALNLILFASFIKHFILLFIDAYRIHPYLFKMMDIYILSPSVLLIAYICFPYSIFPAIIHILLVVSCLTLIATLPFYYATIKPLGFFVVPLILIALSNIYLHTQELLMGSKQLTLAESSTGLFSGTIFFFSFSLQIINRLNHDREQRNIAQQAANHAQQTAITHLEKYYQLYENALDGLFTVRLDGSLLASNPALTKLLALDLTLPTHQLTQLQHYFAEAEVIWANLTYRLLQYSVIEAVEIQGTQSNWYSLSARLLTTADDSTIEGSLIDITERKQQSLELAYLAKHDPLTGLLNRTEFEVHLQEAINKPQYYALLFIDLDQFKVINDTCGHAAGDECLRQIAQLLKAQLTKGETLARLGGDEFGMLINRTTTTSARTRSDSIRAALETHHFIWRTRVFKTTVSIGLLAITRHITSTTYALSLADTACYAAKAAGRNCVMIGDPHCEITLHRHSQMDMVTTLNQALKDDQFILYRQPIAPLLSSNVYLPWYEVLLRLRMGDNIVSPGAFLPAAQRYDLMPQIDYWVFKATCAWLRESDHQQRVGLMNVNLSPETLGHADFIVFVKNTLRDYNINPMLICFEITEYNAISDLTLVLNHLQQLRELGLRFALDDFGSGFASFDYVKRLPVDFIKIDGQFVRDITRNATDRTLVQAVSDIAHNLGKQVIAESVEDQETAAMLRSFGVDFGQGYYFGRPEALFPEVASLASCSEIAA
jgi:diguanylate cyclase (GGDEF)-like protein